MKKKAKQTADPLIWQQYKYLQKSINNEIKKVKMQYFINNQEINKNNPKVTWKLINELNCRNVSNHKSITNIKVGEEIINTPEDMAETFNNHFASIGEKLALDNTRMCCRTRRMFLPAETTFSIKLPNINAVYRKLKTLKLGKAAGLDQIPCKLLKIAAEIVVPSLTQIFDKIICTSTFPEQLNKLRCCGITSRSF